MSNVNSASTPIATTPATTMTATHQSPTSAAGTAPGGPSSSSSSSTPLANNPHPLLDSLLAWFSSCFDLPPASSSWWQQHRGQRGQWSSALASILHKIDPAHFPAKWADSLQVMSPEPGHSSTNSSSSSGSGSALQPLADPNPRILLNYFKKLVHALVEYYQEALQTALIDNFPLPEPARLLQDHPQDKGRLLQLVMGCAVNCDSKETYIASIMNMEESIQQVIMQAIQELLDLPAVSLMTPRSRDTFSTEPADNLEGLTPSDLRRIMDDLAQANQDKDELKQRCHDLENQVELLKDEKLNISTENEQLHAQISGKPSRNHADESNLHQAGATLDLKKRLEVMQDDLFKLESQKEELQVKVDHLDKQLEAAHLKEVELQKSADQALKLKDELDILRETSDKVNQYEVAIESYKKKLEDMSDLKRQLKILEEKNTEFMQRNMDLEEDVKKTGNWRPQVDAYKKQIAELHAKLDSESKKSDRLEFERKRLLEKVESLTVEKDRLHHEREQLRIKHDELQDEIKFGQATCTETQTGLLMDDGEPDSGTLEMIPPSIKERLLRLQRENKRLNLALSGGSSSLSVGGKDSGNIQVLQSMIDTMKERSNELEDANRKANQKILELESKLEDNLMANSTAVPRIPGSKEELELKLAESKKKLTSLQEAMQKKDVEIQAMEERYQRYIEKAKSVIKTFEPKPAGVGGGSSGSSVGGGGGPEMVMLRSQINDKDRIIENIEQENEKARAVREMEDRLITSAFYNLSMQMHRNAVENRLGTTNPGVQGQSSSSSASFLARQRQINNQRGRSGYNSSEFLDY